jgi:hypothetical protein
MSFSHEYLFGKAVNSKYSLWYNIVNDKTLGFRYNRYNEENICDHHCPGFTS